MICQGFDVSDKDAFKKLEELEKTLKIERELKQRMADRSARAFFKQFGKMVEECDVIIQVRRGFSYSVQVIDEVEC